MAIDKLSHIKTEVAKLSSRLNPIEKAQGLFICCPYHAGGREKTPSGKINLTSTASAVGHFHCFGCHANESWNKLAATLNMAGFKKSDEINDVYAFSIKKETARRNKDLEDPTQLKRWNRDTKWRSIENKTLRKFGAVLTADPRYSYNYELYLPVYVHKAYVGGIYCRKTMNKKLKKEGHISYINTKGGWTKKALFGFNIAMKQRGPLWIVEGPRDTLKVYQLGGRVVGTMGSYFGIDKAKLVEALDPPYIIIASDPDEAGDRMAEAIQKLLPMIPCYRLRFPKGKDPAQLRARKYKHITRKIKEVMHVR